MHLLDASLLSKCGSNTQAAMRTDMQSASQLLQSTCGGLWNFQNHTSLHTYTYISALLQVEAMQGRAVMLQQPAAAHPWVAMCQRPWRTSWQL
jgi:hypothetical protein